MTLLVLLAILIAPGIPTASAHTKTSEPAPPASAPEPGSDFLSPLCLLGGSPSPLCGYVLAGSLPGLEAGGAHHGAEFLSSSRRGFDVFAGEFGKSRAQRMHACLAAQPFGSHEAQRYAPGKSWRASRLRARGVTRFPALQDLSAVTRNAYSLYLYCMSRRAPIGVNP